MRLLIRTSFGVVAQLIERYVRIVEVVGLSPISSTKVLCRPMGGFLFFAHVGAWLSSLRVRIDELQQR